MLIANFKQKKTTAASRSLLAAFVLLCGFRAILVVCLNFIFVHKVHKIVYGYEVYASVTNTFN